MPGQNNQATEPKVAALTMLGEIEEFNNNPTLYTEHGEIFDYCRYTIEYLTPICLAIDKDKAKDLLAQMLQALEYILEHDTIDHTQWQILVALLDRLAIWHITNQPSAQNSKNDNGILFYITINSLCETASIRAKMLEWFSRKEIQEFTQIYIYTLVIYKDIKFDLVAIYEFLQAINTTDNNYQEQLLDLQQKVSSALAVRAAESLTATDTTMDAAAAAPEARDDIPAPNIAPPITSATAEHCSVPPPSTCSCTIFGLSPTAIVDAALIAFALTQAKKFFKL